jgi:phosphoribosyl-AMP cyclohydrolase
MENKKQEQPDPHLDIPAESNREKHINFMEVEEESAGKTGETRKEDFSRERGEQWKKGIEEGERARQDNLGNDH